MKRYMKLINRPHEGDQYRKINSYLIYKKNVSLTNECRRHFLEGQEFLSKGGIKHTKREANATIIQRQYRVTYVDDKTFHYNFTCRLTSASLRKNMMNSGIFGNYHIHYDPFFGFGCQYVIIIPCCCNSCIETIKSEWVEGK